MQPQNFAYIRLLKKPYENESLWKGKFDPLKAASILKFGTFLNGTRSLNGEIFRIMIYISRLWVIMVILIIIDICRLEVKDLEFN